MTQTNRANKIEVVRPTGAFGSFRTEIEICFPAHRMTVDEATKFMKDLELAVAEAKKN